MKCNLIKVTDIFMYTFWMYTFWSFVTWTPLQSDNESDGDSLKCDLKRHNQLLIVSLPHTVCHMPLWFQVEPKSFALFSNINTNALQIIIIIIIFYCFVEDISLMQRHWETLDDIGIKATKIFNLKCSEKCFLRGKWITLWQNVMVNE